MGLPLPELEAYAQAVAGGEAGEDVLAALLQRLELGGEAGAEGEEAAAIGATGPAAQPAAGRPLVQEIGGDSDDGDSSSSDSSSSDGSSDSDDGGDDSSDAGDDSSDAGDGSSDGGDDAAAAHDVGPSA